MKLLFPKKFGKWFIGFLIYPFPLRIPKKIIWFIIEVLLW